MKNELKFIKEKEVEEITEVYVTQQYSYKGKDVIVTKHSKYSTLTGEGGTEYEIQVDDMYDDFTEQEIDEIQELLDNEGE